jgi:hypothetical protein
MRERGVSALSFEGNKKIDTLEKGGAGWRLG